MWRASFACRYLERFHFCRPSHWLVHKSQSTWTAISGQQQQQRASELRHERFARVFAVSRHLLGGGSGRLKLICFPARALVNFPLFQFAQANAQWRLSRNPAAVGIVSLIQFPAHWCRQTTLPAAGQSVARSLARSLAVVVVRRPWQLIRPAQRPGQTSAQSAPWRR